MKLKFESPQQGAEKRGKMEKDMDEILSSPKMNRPRPSLEDFSDVYTPEELAAQQEELERKKRRRGITEKDLSEKDFSEKQGEAVEYITGHHIEMSNWLGERAMSYKTSERDDIVGQVDAVIEIVTEDQEGVHRFALAIDVYSGANPKFLEEKLSGCVQRITGEKGAQAIMHFQSEITDYKGKLENVVPTVFVVNEDNAEDLVHDVAKALRLEKEKKELQGRELPVDMIKKELKELNRKMEYHPAQIWLLDQLKVQLDSYMSLSDSESPNVNVPEETKEEIQTLLDIIDKIKNEKVESFSEAGIDPEYINNSEAADGIKKILDDLVRERS